MLMKWFNIPNYTMKCRLYPNKGKAAAIDAAIYAVQCYHNCAVYDLFHGFHNTIEKEAKKKQGDNEKPESELPGVVHFPDYKKIFGKDYKASLTEQHPVIACAPAGAITSNNGLRADLAKELGNKPIEYQEPNYYHKSRPRRSYTYQETLGKIRRSENKKVFYISLAKIGEVKVRGYNPDIRFAEDGSVDFLDYADANPRNVISVTVSKDNCGDYYICFKLANVYKQFASVPDTQVGVDVGVRHIAIQSDGKKYENKRFKDAAAEHHAELNRRLSRRQGWTNGEFRKAHKKDPTLQVSKKYERTKQKLAKLDRKTARKRSDWNHQVSHSIVSDHGMIAVETLAVKEMIEYRQIASELADAAMGDVLNMIKYKSEWYGRDLRLTPQDYPSTQICSCCGYQNTDLVDNLPLTWVCPSCRTEHDIDVNAAKNLLALAVSASKDQAAVEA